MTQDSSLELPTQADPRRQASTPGALLVARTFLVALGILLAGYMFLGRGFAHIGIGPIYVGDVILLLGVLTSAFVAIRAGVRAPITWTVALLLVFAALGAVRTVPYLGTHGLDALRDGVLWGYAGFALIVYLLADRALLLRAFRLYGWVVPIFALWLPISWNLFAAASADIDPSRPGSFVPLVFFKGGDMAVHAVGVIAFLVLAAPAIWSAWGFVWRMLVCLPLLWTALVAGTSNRGALLTVAVGIVAVALLAPRWRAWLPLLAATTLGAVVMVVQGVFTAIGAPVATPSIQPSTPPPRTVAIANPGFELGSPGSDRIEGWDVAGLGQRSIVADGGYRGTNFASVENVSGPYEAALISSSFSFKYGEDIRVSVWVKAIAARPILAIVVNWADRSGTVISTTSIKKLPTDGVQTWQEYAGALAAPPKTAQARVLFYEASGRATMGIDEVTIMSGDFIPPPVPPKGRPATLQQMIENLLSIFGSSSEGGLEGSKQFRLAWWGKIVDYTVFGKYFWTGKGFGVNLADDDGFQTTVDHSLRSPHNSHITVLARMGVPGLLLWLLVQGAFGIGLLRAVFAHRRGGDQRLALLSGLILAYWVAMMVDTSFDPYLEGPQGGIWFWTIFGLGLAIMRLVPRRTVAA